MLGVSDEHARVIDVQLRQSGLPLRSGSLADLEELDDVLQRGTPDLLLCADVGGFSSTVALQRCRELMPELPVLVLGTSANPAASSAALVLGARDRVCAGDADALAHLVEVFSREWRQLNQDRELYLARARLKGLEAAHLNRLPESGDALLQVRDGLIEYANAAFASLLGLRSEALNGRALSTLLPVNQQPRIKEFIRQLLRARIAPGSLQTELLRADGSSLPVAAQLSVGSLDNRRFVEWCIPGTSPAAGTPSGSAADRLALYRALEQTSTDTRPRAAMLFLIDDFASIETRLGLQDAERLLTQVASALATRIGSGSTLFRFSTNEWVALVSRNTVGEIEKLAERLGRELAQQVFTPGQHETQITLTIGAYPMAADESGVAAIDRLIHEGRRLSSAGGAQVAILGPTAKNHAEQRENARRAALLKRALDEDRLHLAYQSIASLDGETRPHFDVLVRMTDDNGQELHAGEFIAAAEQFGLMQALDRWVITRALKVLAKRESKQDIPVLLVKLSEQSLRDPDELMSWLRPLLSARSLQQDELCFSIQEAAAQNQLLKTQQLAQTLGELGSGLTIEQFGMGSHAAQLLQQLPVRFIKFSPQFTRQFNERETQKKLGDLLILAREKNVRTIVSQVEDANMIARMWQLGVNYIQGYHVQEPDAFLIGV